MPVQLVAEKTAKCPRDTDLLVLPFYKVGSGVKAAFSFSVPETAKPALTSGDFSGKEGETLVVYPPHKKENRLVLLGLGEQKTDAESLRKTGAVIAKLCRQKKWTSACIAFPNYAFAEGLLLGSYTFEIKEKKEAQELKKVYFLQSDRAFAKQLEKLATIGDAVNYTRELVNGNADDIHADRLVDEAKRLAKTSPIKITILRKKELEEESLGLMLAVNRAALREPALVILEYRGLPKSKEMTAIFGKGVVYDTGGLSLKTSGMETMKCDMAGTATVLGILKAASALKIKANILGVLGIVENSIGPASYKLGDVYKGRGGKTVEITSTDAEGRLVLADIISYVQDKYKNLHMIDLATLTGGAVVAIGEEFAALFCNDDRLAKSLVTSGQATGDFVWRMPLAKGYGEMLKSKIADLKNAAGRKASPCTAAAFIQAFVKEGTPWAHLDIAGTAFLDDPKGYHCSNATGFGVRLLLDFLGESRN